VTTSNRGTSLAVDGVPSPPTGPGSIAMSGRLSVLWTRYPRSKLHQGVPGRARGTGHWHCAAWSL